MALITGYVMPARPEASQYGWSTNATLTPGTGGAEDIAPPVVVLVSPASSGVLPGATRAAARRAPVTLRVTDDHPGLRAVLVLVQYVSDPHVYLAYDSEVAVNDGFTAEFVSSVAAVVRTPASGTAMQMDITLWPVGGWPGEVSSLRLVAYDRAGNLEASL